MKAVSDGRADVTYLPITTSKNLIENAETYNLKAFSASVYKERLTLGVYDGDSPYLWHILNKELNHFDSSFIVNSINKGIQTEMKLTPGWLIHHNPIQVVLFSLLIGGGVIGFLYYRNKMNQKHFDLVQHMAYTDLRYNLPNVPWLEKETPKVFEKLKSRNSGLQTFFVVFSLWSDIAVIERYGRELVMKHFNYMAKNLSRKKWVELTAAGIDVGHLICFCKAENNEKIIELVSEAIQEFHYFETADAKATIVLHMQAGICRYDHETYVQQTIERANVACHQPSDKEVKFFDDILQEHLTMQHKIETHMEQALADGEFKAWYQPKYDIRTKKIVGAEALVRWISPDMGFLPPGRFIPLLERNGFVIQVDYFLLEQTFQLQKRRLEEGKEVVPISVNQSRLHMTEDGYIEKMKAIVDSYQLPPGLIELEITETIFGDFDQKESRENATNIVSELHALGCSLSVDDFGSGFSSYTMLSYLPLDVMKIDRSLLVAADDSKRMRDILGNVINLGKTLDMKVICEGIETPEHEELLLELGCHYGQGYLNAKPMPMKDFEEFLEERNAEVAANF